MSTGYLATSNTVNDYDINIENDECRTAEPVPRQALDTGEVDDKRLM
jgi:hypothetical protein